MPPISVSALNEVFPGEGYRIGGDEFVVLRCPIGQEDFADKVHQLREALVRHGVDAAIGSFWQPLVEDLPAFLREADGPDVQGKGTPEALCAAFRLGKSFGI